MAVITMLSVKAAPGVTTSVTALATMWPGPLLVVDADPAGGDLLPGWAGPWWVDGRLRAEVGVVSFASATRHLPTVPAEGLATHVQEFPQAEAVRLLAGVRDRAQADAVGVAGWHRLAAAIRDLADNGVPDVFIDAGRFGPDVPWPLLAAADIVLLAIRPHLRHVAAAYPMVDAIRDTLSGGRLAAAVLATSRRQAHNAAEALDLPLLLALPEDPSAARLFSEGPTEGRRLWDSRLARAVRRATPDLRVEAATRLATAEITAESMPHPPVVEQPAMSADGRRAS